jgi:hypothetical protein
MTEIRDLHDRSLMTETHSDKEIVICFEGEKTAAGCCDQITALISPTVDTNNKTIDWQQDNIAWHAPERMECVKAEQNGQKQLGYTTQRAVETEPPRTRERFLKLVCGKRQGAVEPTRYGGGHLPS